MYKYIMTAFKEDQKEYLSLNFSELKLSGKNINSTSFEECSFKAIVEGDPHYSIIPERCDACGSCYMVCPEEAIEPAGNL